VLTKGELAWSILAVLIVAASAVGGWAVSGTKLVDPALGGLEDIVDELVGLGSSSIVSEARP
jgi:hypothetical protein